MTSQRLPITNSLLATIFQAMDMTSYDHCMFWAACTLGYFGFLRSAEFTVPNSSSFFFPGLHLEVGDVAVDWTLHPSCSRVRIKTSKTDPFHQGCFIHIGWAQQWKQSLPTWYGEDFALDMITAYLLVASDIGQHG